LRLPLALEDLGARRIPPSSTIVNHAETVSEEVFLGMR
jgi:hypothetical protein